MTMLAFGAGIVGNLVLIMFYYWSRLDDTIASRFALPMCLLLALAAQDVVQDGPLGRSGKSDEPESQQRRVGPAALAMRHHGAQFHFAGEAAVIAEGQRAGREAGAGDVLARRHRGDAGEASAAYVLRLERERFARAALQPYLHRVAQARRHSEEVAPLQVKQIRRQFDCEGCVAVVLEAPGAARSELHRHAPVPAAEDDAPAPQQPRAQRRVRSQPEDQAPGGRIQTLDRGDQHTPAVIEMYADRLTGVAERSQDPQDVFP
jgi:hypothetical protein